MCRDQLPFVDHDRLVELAGDEPGYRGAFVDAPIVDICKVWDAGTADRSVHEPVESDVPALLAFGRFDPYAPQSLVEEAATTLSRSRLVEIPVEGYNVFSNECAIELRNGWLDDPTSPPDMTCVEGMAPLEFATSIR